MIEIITFPHTISLQSFILNYTHWQLLFYSENPIYRKNMLIKNSFLRKGNFVKNTDVMFWLKPLTMSPCLKPLIITPSYYII